MPAEALIRYTEIQAKDANAKDESQRDESHGCHIASHNSNRRNCGCYIIERRGCALPPRLLVRQNHSLVYRAFAGFWFALLFPVRPFSLLLQLLQ
jgi:hypothetical protein